ncbi:MAG: ECF transporter S component [Lachnospiraceae bacterium]
MIQLSSTKKLVYAALFLALALVLPMLIGQIPEIGSVLSPMHIPVLLCGFICGAKYGALVGFTAPLLKTALFTIPPLYPTALAMSFELLTYGLVAGLLYAVLHKHIAHIYINLIGAMIAGRIVWGLSMLVLLSVKGQAFTFSAFLASAFITAIPGIITHIIVIPVLVIMAQKFLTSESKR